MSSGRRFPNLLLAMMVLLTVLGIALFFLAAMAKSLQQALREAERAAQQEREEDVSEQLRPALEQYHQSLSVAAPDPSAPGEPSPPSGPHDKTEEPAAEPPPVEGESKLDEQPAGEGLP